jgi:GntR family transcriptional regulator
MKFWISKNSEVPVREQIVTQVTLGIASGELAAGDKLPSTGAIARRFGVHANTVSHAYQELAATGWLEFRRGSGFWVRDLADDAENSLERLVAVFLKRARELGFTSEEVAECAARFTRNARAGTVLLLEDDGDYAAILAAELAAYLSIPVETRPTTGFLRTKDAAGSIIVAMFDERPKIAPDVDCVFLNSSSAAAAMAREARPADHDLIAVVSGWDKFRWLARTLLVAARIEPDCLIVRSTDERGWGKDIALASLVICDSLTSGSLPDDPRVRTFRLISDESLADLRRVLSL